MPFNAILCDDDMPSIIICVSPPFIIIPLPHNRVPSKSAAKRGIKHHSSPKFPPLLKSVEAASRLGLTVILSVTVGALVVLVVVSVVVDTVVSLKVVTLLEVVTLLDVVTLSSQRSALFFSTYVRAACQNLHANCSLYQVFGASRTSAKS